MNNNYNYDLYNNNMMNYPNQTNIDKQPIFAEDVLAKNKGKYVKLYMSFTDSKEWCDRIFEGTLESWGRDFILLKDKNSNKRYMVWNLYIDFIEFFEPVNI
ncbi:MAG: spore coat protein GerQ [Bacilli bacterium]|nr:spore coat protein GerQ [Bacilli bacterium]